MTDIKTASQLLAEAIKVADDAAAKVVALKVQSRAEDLATAKALCVTHGFTATDLKGSLVVKRGSAAKKAATPRKSTSRSKAK